MKAEGRTVEEPGLFVSQLRWLFFGSTFAGMCFKTFGQVWTNPMSGKPLITDNSSWVFSLPACSQGGFVPHSSRGSVRDEVPDVSRFRQKELLGSGGFADVYRQGLMGISGQT